MEQEDMIREAAYAIWEAEGRPNDRADEHWRMAEESLRAADIRFAQDAPEPSKGRGRASSRRKAG